MDMSMTPPSMRYKALILDLFSSRYGYAKILTFKLTQRLFHLVAWLTLITPVNHYCFQDTVQHMFAN